MADTSLPAATMADQFFLAYEDTFGQQPTEPSSKEEVIRVLDLICKLNGYVDAHEDTRLRDSLDPQDQTIKILTRRTRGLLQRFTKTISVGIYDDQFRFFYEILQNADDARRGVADLTDTQPCVTFTIRPDSLIVDLIENEFELEDVLAMCSVGESSKQSSETIGNKGFGFKAVFGVASAAHIQSGRWWSFQLTCEHDNGDIRMVAPRWQSIRTLPRNVSTRITLMFKDKAVDGNLYLRLCDWVQKQPVSIIGFLKKIRKVRLVLEDADGVYKDILFQHLAQRRHGFQELAETIDGTRKVYTFREIISLTSDIDTEDNDTEDSDATPPAEIVLRFPISDKERCEPIIDPHGQYTFAYLPIRQLPQLPFIIQANFTLPANRQDVANNRWNRSLKRKVARLFADAVETFAAEGSHALQFHWPDYLPARLQPITGFWHDLSSLIQTALARRQVFVSYSGALSHASRLRSLPSIFLHHNLPILREVNTNSYSYLALKYRDSDFDVLRDIGIQDLSTQDMLAIVADDCESALSQCQEKSLADSWHDSYAKLLESLVNDQETAVRSNIIASLREFAIFPVRTVDGLEWQSWNESIYFPTLVQEVSNTEDSDNCSIIMPTDLGFTVLHPKAVTGEARRQMYRLLGIIDCPPKEIQKAILRVQERSQSFKYRDILAHFELLFWYADWTDLEGKLYAASVDRHFRQSNRLFFRSDDPFDIATLLRSSETSDYDEFFLDDMYVDSQVKSFHRGGKTWYEWLEKVAGVSYHPSLDDPDDPESLHPLVVAVREDNPESFLPMIQEYWRQSYLKTCSSTAIRKAILESFVPCANGNQTRLRSTWFPSPAIKNEASKFGVAAELPILLLPDSDPGCHVSEWPALRDLNIPADTNLAFYEQVLIIMAEQPGAQEDKICDIYEKMGSLASPEQQAHLQKLFEKRALIWDSGSREWLSSSKCVWKSAIKLQSWFVVTSLYPEQNVRNLFMTSLDLPNATIDCYICELEEMAKDDTEVGNPDRASEIYKVLHNVAKEDESQQSVRSRFRDQNLIYHLGKWFSPKDCIWHATLKLGNYANIQSTYPELKDFFVDILQVKTITATFMMQQLAKAALVPDETIRELMLETGKIIPDKYEDRDYSKSINTLRSARFLPCKSPQGGRIFLTLAGSFFIVDNQKYADLFATKLCTVDFSYRELTTLHKLFGLLGLQDRYLSRHVETQTTVDQVVLNHPLTRDLQDCAYALSCCAVFYHSPLYSHDSSTMHELLRSARVYTASDVRTEYVVRQDRKKIQVLAKKAFLTTDIDEQYLRVVLPENTAEGRLCLQGQLPNKLVEILRISNTSAERQIYRLINETDIGTDQILADEGIPHTDTWLSKTQRLPNRRGGFLSNDGGVADEYDNISLMSEDLEETTMDVSSNHAVRRERRHSSQLAEFPERTNGVNGASGYARLLEHLRRSAFDVERRGTRPDGDLVAINDHATFLRNLVNMRANSTDSHRYPELFGDDGRVKHRVGTAGELFVFELLRSLTHDRIDQEQWRSKYRHLVRVHESYRDIQTWNQPETADIVYDDAVVDEDYNDYENAVEEDEHQSFEWETLKERFQRQVIGDSFDGWLPQWMSGECTCTETDDGSSVDDQEPSEVDEVRTDDDLSDSNEDEDNLSNGGSSSNSDSTYSPSMSSSVMMASAGLCQGCMEVEEDPYEWLFEVKTTLGPCETPFDLSSKQYDLMRTAGMFDGYGRRTVYCIVRVYNLLETEVGIRIYIDPWRFRNDKLQLIPSSKWQVRAT